MMKWLMQLSGFQESRPGTNTKPTQVVGREYQGAENSGEELKMAP